MFVFKGGKLQYYQALKTPFKSTEKAAEVDNFHLLLRGYQLRHKLSNRAMAKLIGVTPVTYGDWIRKGQRPAHIYRRKLNQLCKIELRDKRKVMGLRVKKSEVPHPFTPQRNFQEITKPLI